MIWMPSMFDVEVRILRAVMSRPQLLSAVADVEVDDFVALPHRMLWTVLRDVEVSGIPADHYALCTECASRLHKRNGWLPDNGLGVLSDELMGIIGPRPMLDRRIMTPDTATPLARLASEIKDDAATLRYVRLARQQMIEQGGGRR